MTDVTDRTAYIPGTMFLARRVAPKPPKGSPIEAWRAWFDADLPGGEFNEVLAQLYLEESEQ